MSDLHAAALIFICALVTIFLRFIPFAVFRNRQTPKFIAFLGNVLPYSIMGMLVVYCLRSTSFHSAAGYLPQFLACALVAALHLWKRNTLLSIIGGTVCYMILVQLVF